MTTPTELVVSKTPQTVTIELDESLYPRDALYGAAYVFLERCYIFLDRVTESGSRVRVQLRSKAGELDGDAIAGEFQNELLGQAWRRQLANDSRVLIEAVTARALGGAAGPPGLEDLLEMEVGSTTAFEDPLGIAMSWEEKYAKGKRQAPPGSGEQDPTGPGVEPHPDAKGVRAELKPADDPAPVASEKAGDAP